VAADAARGASALGIRVIEVDGRQDADALTAAVAAHFAAWLPVPDLPPVRAAQLG
jgi:hypothetical protein